MMIIVSNLMLRTRAIHSKRRRLLVESANRCGVGEFMVSRGRTLKWFGVKTVFRSRAVGAPKFKTADYDPKATLVEERVVLVRARTFDSALRTAEREARKYAKHVHPNPFGQRVVTRYLEVCDAFEMFERPAPLVEVFSSTQLVPGSVGDRDILAQKFSPVETAAQRRSRQKFGDALFYRVKTPIAT
jgi:hypothetical protein